MTLMPVIFRTPKFLNRPHAGPVNSPLQKIMEICPI